MLKYLQTSKNFGIVRYKSGATLQDTSTRTTPEGIDGYNRFVDQGLLSMVRKFQGREKFEKLKQVLIFCGRKVCCLYCVLYTIDPFYYELYLYE